MMGGSKVIKSNGLGINWRRKEMDRKGGERVGERETRGEER